MTHRLALIAVVVVVAVCLSSVQQAAAFQLRPKAVKVVGTAKKNSYLWKPTRSGVIGSTVGFARVSKSADECDRRKCGDCKYAVAFTADGGDTFHLDDRSEVEKFCGAGGLIIADELAVKCVGRYLRKTDASPANEDLGLDSVPEQLVYATRKFTFKPNADSSTLPSIGVSESDEDVIYYGLPNISAVADGAGKGEMAAVDKLFFGDTIATFSSPKLGVVLGRNVEVLLTNGTYVHAFYRSLDNGTSWDFVSIVPFPMGIDSAVHALGSTKAMLVAGAPGKYRQVTTVYMGNRWEREENVTYGTPLSAYTSEYATTIYGGLRGRPGLHGMAAGTKRGTEKTLNYADMHNRMVARMRKLAVDDDADSTSEKPTPDPWALQPLPAHVTNFSSHYVSAATFGDCYTSPLDSNGCASSSYTGIISLKNDTVFAFYDMLRGGYSPSTTDADAPAPDQTLFVMKMHLNETKEFTEKLDKLKEEARAEEKRQEAEKQRKEAAKELERKKRRERREKIRQDKVKKAEFAKLDERNIQLAKMHFEEDGDVIVVRDVRMEYVEHEKDTFFDEIVSPSSVPAADQNEGGLQDDEGEA